MENENLHRQAPMWVKIALIVATVTCLFVGYKNRTCHSDELNKLFDMEMEGKQKTELIDGFDYANTTNIKNAEARIHNSNLTEEEKNWLLNELQIRHEAVKEGYSYQLYPDPQALESLSNYVDRLMIKSIVWFLFGVVFFSGYISIICKHSRTLFIVLSSLCLIVGVFFCLGGGWGIKIGDRLLHITGPEFLFYGVVFIVTYAILFLHQRSLYIKGLYDHNN